MRTLTDGALVYTRDTGLEIYDVLVEQFGDKAASTIVYTYVFRLGGFELASFFVLSLTCYTIQLEPKPRDLRPLALLTPLAPFNKGADRPMSGASEQDIGFS